jgi:DNA-binding MarR family transcriptional regulator
VAKPKRTGSATLASDLAVELHALVGKLKRRLRQEAHLGDLTSSQAAVLGQLDRHGPATVTALARAAGVRSQSMGATVSELEAARLVSAAPHPTDGRQTLWSLTAACRARIKAGRAAREDWLSRTLVTKLTPAEQAQVGRAVTLLQRLVDS